MDIEIVRWQSSHIKLIRKFFDQKKFLEVMPPLLVENPGMETHIHPFSIYSPMQKAHRPLYLPTSPEFHMKELLSLNSGDIYTLNYSFRDEPNSTHHRPQFLMLEWYRANEHYKKLMDDCEELFTFLVQHYPGQNIPLHSSYHSFSHYQRATIAEIFLDVLNIDILDFLEKDDLKKLIEQNFRDVPLPTNGEDLSWDDYYFLLFLNKIEPHLAHYPYLLLSEFPHHLSALSTLKKEDPRVCERFEIYCHGIELCNAFNELTDLKLQKLRFQSQAKEKHQLYHYELPTPHRFYRTLERGLPTSSGIALGVDRLMKILTGIDNPFWD